MENSTIRCIECGAPASEQHHILPKVMGGTQTVPLCTPCHAKIHGLDKTRRADNHSENVKRGIDKGRAWLFLAIYDAIHSFDAKGVEEIRTILEDKYQLQISIESLKRKMKRYYEVGDNYLIYLFNNEIENNLSYIWDKDNALMKGAISYKIFSEYCTQNKITIKDIPRNIQTMLLKKAEEDFLNYIENKKPTL